MIPLARHDWFEAFRHGFLGMNVYKTASLREDDEKGCAFGGATGASESEEGKR